MKKGKNIIIWGFSITGILVFIAFILMGNKEAADNEIRKELSPIPYTAVVAYATEMNIPGEAVFRGHIAAKNIVNIFSEGEGKLTSSSVELGRTVRKGQVIGQIDKTIRSAANQINVLGLDKAKTDYETARRNSARFEALLKEDNASYVEVENARLQLSSAEMQLKTYQQQLQISRKQVGQTNIISPANGVIVEKKSNPGDYISPGTLLGVIAELDHVLVKVAVPEYLITKIQLGGTVSIKPDVYAKTVLKGKIKTIIPLANEAKAFPVEIEIPNHKTTPLMSGMNVSVHFNENLFTKALSIPRTALLRDVKGNYVYVIDARKKPLRKMVVPGRDIGTAVEIKAGLAKGDLVISSGQGNVEPGKVLKSYTISTP